METLFAQVQPHLIIIAVSGLVTVVVIRHIILRIIYLLSRSTELDRMSFDVLRKHYFPSLYVFLGLFLYDVIAFAFELEVYEDLFNTMVLISFTWVMSKTIKLISMIVYRKFSYLHKDNIRERKIHTQALFLEKVLVVVVWIIGLSFALLSVEEVKGLGGKLLASAGVLSVVVGFAAQKGLANLIAGFQIAFTQPIRIDDVVVVEGEWGRIEEITLTYVVVKIWDWRRLVLPVTYFTQNPFQNWTRSSSALLNNITLWVDYTFDVQKLRDAMPAIMASSPHFNGEFWNVQVVETSEQAMQIRLLMTADDSPSSWDLKCDVREKVLAHVRETQPEALPRMRFGPDRFESGGSGDS